MDPRGERRIRKARGKRAGAHLRCAREGREVRPVVFLRDDHARRGDRERGLPRRRRLLRVQRAAGRARDDRPRARLRRQGRARALRGGVGPAVAGAPREIEARRAAADPRRGARANRQDRVEQDREPRRGREAGRRAQQDGRDRGRRQRERALRDHAGVDAGGAARRRLQVRAALSRSPGAVILAAFQFAPAPGDVARNAAAVERGLRAAAAKGARLVALPELWPTSFAYGYLKAALASTQRALESARAVSRELCLVVVGSALADSGRARPLNLGHVIDRGDVLARYAKAHLFTPTHEDKG